MINRGLHSKILGVWYRTFCFLPTQNIRIINSNTFGEEKIYSDFEAKTSTTNNNNYSIHFNNSHSRLKLLINNAISIENSYIHLNISVDNVWIYVNMRGDNNNDRKTAKRKIKSNICVQNRNRMQFEMPKY